MPSQRHTPPLLWGALLLLPFTPACELIPGLVHGDAPPPSAATSALTVAIDSAQGEIAGQTLALASLEAHGVQQLGGVDLTVHIDPDTFLQLTTPEDIGGDNPYGGSGERPLPGDEPRGFPGDDAGASSSGISAGPQPVVVVCSSTGCREPAEFVLRSAEGADGRHMVFEGQWDGGDRADIELHYRREQ